MRYFIRSCVTISFIVAAVVASKTNATAEILPTKGRFRGVYHENRAGVGHFSFCIVPAEIRKQLAPFDGKYIEIDVLQGRQPFRPGPVVIDQIGEVKELDQGPLRIEMRIVTPGSFFSDAFDVVYAFRNVSKETVELDANNVAIGLQQYGTVDRPNEHDAFFGTGYTREQLGFRGEPEQRWNFISPMHLGARTHFYTGPVQLKPGEAAPFVWHSIRADSGPHELVASTQFRSKDGVETPAMAWLQVDLPLAKPPEKMRERLAIEAKVMRDAEGLLVEGRLTNTTGKPVHMFVQEGKNRYFFPGMLGLFDKNEEYLGTVLEWEPEYVVWTRKAIPKEGLPFHFRVSQADLFSMAQEDHLEFWTVTEHGIEKFAIANLPPRPPQIEPPWGDAVNGCRCRMRLTKDRYSAKEAIKVCVVAESDRKHADVLWIDKGNGPSHVRIEIDGKPARISSTGLPDAHVLPFPHQAGIELNPDATPTQGKHKLQVKITGDPGTYTNLHGDKSRQFDGTLISNVVEFEVVE